MAKRKVKEPTEAEKALAEQKNIDDILRRFHPYPPASRLFQVGDIIQYGGHPNAQVLAVYDGGRCYKLKVWGEYSEYSSKVYREQISLTTWEPLCSLAEKDRPDTNVRKNTEFQLTYSSMTIDSFISDVYHFGVDMNPSYQRDYVWSPEDSVALIDSIFNNRSIGSYVLCHNGYSTDCMYEILDGKQRAKAILDFYEDKFRYNGYLFSELSWKDQNHFEGFPFPRAEVKQPTLEQKIKIFMHVNTSGRHMSKEHLDKVQNMLYSEVK